MEMNTITDTIISQQKLLDAFNDMGYLCSTLETVVSLIGVGEDINLCGRVSLLSTKVVKNLKSLVSA
jgi:hypothetical protein